MEIKRIRHGVRSRVIPGVLLICGLMYVFSTGCSNGEGEVSPVATTSGNTPTADATRGTITVSLTFPSAKRAAELPHSTSKPAAPPPVTSGNVDTKATVTNGSSEAKAKAANGDARTRSTNGNIPIGTTVVKIVITNPSDGSVLASRLVNGPATNGELPASITVNFAALPAGPVKVDVTAYPDAAAALTPIAAGSVSATVVPLKETPVSVNLTFALASLTLTPRMAFVTIAPGPVHTFTLVASLLDSNDNSLTLPVMWTNSDPDILSMEIDPANPYKVTVTGVQLGTSTITIYEPNSGNTASTVVTVTRE